jgi:hypothetical protein
MKAGRWVKVGQKVGIVFQVGPREGTRLDKKAVKDDQVVVHFVDSKGETADEQVVDVKRVARLEDRKGIPASRR